MYRGKELDGEIGWLIRARNEDGPEYTNRILKEMDQATWVL